MQKTQTVRIQEAARLLGIGRNTAYSAAKRGEIPTVRIGGLLLVPRAALDAMLRKTSEATKSVE